MTRAPQFNIPLLPMQLPIVFGNGLVSHSPHAGLKSDVDSENPLKRVKSHPSTRFNGFWLLALKFISWRGDAIDRSPLNHGTNPRAIYSSNHRAIATSILIVDRATPRRIKIRR